MNFTLIITVSGVSREGAPLYFQTGPLPYLRVWMNAPLPTLSYCLDLPPIVFEALQR